MNAKSNERHRNGPTDVTDNPITGSGKSFNSTEIFADHHEVIIEHEGDQYRLRRTKNGKLILTK